MTASVESVTEPDTNPRVSCAFRGADVPNKKSKKILKKRLTMFRLEWTWHHSSFRIERVDAK